ncbi:DUF7674 family protein [Undibacterium aquatile]|uniref:DUF7674 domain-containing protein n=1 Tax=Undibacterium aquatile TaxID=1537398 RepID=A0ABR6XJ28_9BURK|nr:hypothetical protein [Undibacterium aquatile]MBC3812861.1 hypothetical protein [Undibacterium aquatile]
MQILVDACPSFEDQWKQHVEAFGNDVLYLAAGEFAAHLLERFQAGDAEAFRAVGIAIERLHTEGTPWVREFATIGVLEGIQNVWSHSATSPEAFFPFLGLESQRWWRGLNKFWSAESPYVAAEG